MSIESRPGGKRGTRLDGTMFRASILRLLICCLAIQTACASVFGQDRSKSNPKPRVLLGVLIDTSGHQRKVIQLEREAVDLLAHRLDSVVTESFVFTYGDRVDLLQDWSSIGNGLSKVSAGVQPDPGGGKGTRTLLNDALNAALLKHEARSDFDLKVLIVIGEGNSWGSTAKYAQIKRLAKSMPVQCFALLVADHGLMGGRVRQFGFYLDDLAWSTNGNGYDVGTSRKHLDKAVSDVLKRVTRQSQAYKK